jgi:hypothetical protein
LEHVTLGFRAERPRNVWNQAVTATLNRKV